MSLKKIGCVPILIKKKEVNCMKMSVSKTRLFVFAVVLGLCYCLIDITKDCDRLSFMDQWRESLSIQALFFLKK